MKIVFASLSELFDELRERKINQARVETVVSNYSKSNLRVLRFDIYVSAKLEDDCFGVVVIPLFKTFQGLAEQQRDEINEKEEALFKQIKERAGDIILKNGSFWEGEPFRGGLD